MDSAARPVVSFDFGDTLVRIDVATLLTKLARLGFTVDTSLLSAAVPRARRVYDEMIARGMPSHPWKPFMAALLEHARLGSASEIAQAVDSLWHDQPRHNLWRQPLAGMIELCRDLRQAGARIGIITNSEGRAKELVDELGWSGVFEVVVDSGIVGVAKPDRRIFEAFADALQVPIGDVIHVGDSLRADVEGALAAGMRAIWFEGRPGEAVPEGAFGCADAAELRLLLTRLCGLPLPVVTER